MGIVSMMGMLEMVVMFIWRPRYTSKVALRAGSSKQGKARRASVAWNCVTPIALRKEGDQHHPTCATLQNTFGRPLTFLITQSSKTLLALVTLMGGSNFVFNSLLAAMTIFFYMQQQ